VSRGQAGDDAADDEAAGEAARETGGQRVTAGTEAAGALAGVRVLELADGWSAGALCGRLLADLGAAVHKLEPPDGDPIRRFGPAGPGGTAYAAASLLHGKLALPADAVRAGAGLLDLTGSIHRTGGVRPIPGWWWPPSPRSAARPTGRAGPDPN
jgi:hypothetical protein